MDPQDAVDLAREAILVALLIGSPVLLAGLLVGLAVGLLQALTQVQEQTVSFVPKLVTMVLVLSFTLPWLLGRFVDYVRELFGHIPETL
ncbi:MAG: flagellar biosynthesis protein FliQ [Pirellulales bacterium]